MGGEFHAPIDHWKLVDHSPDTLPQDTTQLARSLCAAATSLHADVAPLVRTSEGAPSRARTCLVVSSSPGYDLDRAHQSCVGGGARTAGVGVRCDLGGLWGV